MSPKGCPQMSRWTQMYEDVLKYLQTYVLKYLQTDVLKCIQENVLKAFNTNTVKCLQKNKVKCLQRDVLKCLRKNDIISILTDILESFACHWILISTGWCNKMYAHRCIQFPNVWRGMSSKRKSYYFSKLGVQFVWKWL